MKLLNTQSQNGQVQLLFQLPHGYGYNSILDAAQYVIDNHLISIESVRTALLMGLNEHEYRLVLLLHNSRIRKCKSLKKEKGVLFLRGKINCFERSVEFLWFNQTSVIGVLLSDLDKHNFEIIDSIIEDISLILK